MALLVMPIGGDVHVYGVSREGEIREYVKHRGDVRIRRPGRKPGTA